MTTLSDLPDGEIILLSRNPERHARTLAENGIYISASIRAATRYGCLLSVQAGSEEALVVTRGPSLMICVPVTSWDRIVAGAGPVKRLRHAEDTNDAETVDDIAMGIPEGSTGHRDDLIVMLQQRAQAIMTSQKTTQDQSERQIQQEARRQTQ
ncbi:MAG: hypothetical protein LKI93_03840 [Bifidobacteriaceae bacterium]|nr:hypothetical protein [Bifidobacteriaceae bacterium]MCI1914409.1 hypothetical protein [Bifidobacteriaceae bacterium]MCI1935861.1 hypothetical protein [Bifidobacteriaceae bacterium]